MISVSIMNELIKKIREKLKTSNDIVPRVTCPYYFNHSAVPAELTVFKERLTLLRQTSSNLIDERFGKEQTPAGNFAKGSFLHSFTGTLVSLEFKMGECSEVSSALVLAMIATGYHDITFLNLEFKNAKVGMETTHQLIIANLKIAPEQHDSIYDFIKALPSHAVIGDAFLGLSFSPQKIPASFKEYIDAYGGLANISACYHFTNFGMGFLGHVVPKVHSVNASMPEALYTAYHQQGVKAYKASEYLQAKKDFEMAIKERVPLTDAQKLDVATTWYSLGSAEKQLGDMARAKGAYGQAYKTRQEILGEDDPSTQKAKAARDAVSIHNPGTFAQVKPAEQDQKSEASFTI